MTELATGTPIAESLEYIGRWISARSHPLDQIKRMLGIESENAPVQPNKGGAPRHADRQTLASTKMSSLLDALTLESELAWRSVQALRLLLRESGVSEDDIDARLDSDVWSLESETAR